MFIINARLDEIPPSQSEAHSAQGVRCRLGCRVQGFRLDFGIGVWVVGLGVCRCADPLQGYLTHKKKPTPLGPP